MLDIKFVYDNRGLVRENIKKKFQDEKLPLVDEVCEIYDEKRSYQQRGDKLRENRNKLSKEIGNLMAQGKKDEAEKIKVEVKAQGDELASLEVKEAETEEERHAELDKGTRKDVKDKE